MRKCGTAEEDAADDAADEEEAQANAGQENTEEVEELGEPEEEPPGRCARRDCARERRDESPRARARKEPEKRAPETPGAGSSGVAEEHEEAEDAEELETVGGTAVANPSVETRGGRAVTHTGHAKRPKRQRGTPQYAETVKRRRTERRAYMERTRGTGTTGTDARTVATGKRVRDRMEERGDETRADARQHCEAERERGRARTWDPGG